MACVDPNHFQVDPETGAISPQPWMQKRHVATDYAASKSASYAVSGGGNKFDLIHSLHTRWTNDTPLPQWCYGLVTRGGSKVTLQARSRGYLITYHGAAVNNPAGTPQPTDAFGIGADIGKSGLLATGTGFCVAETRQHAATFPLIPFFTGWSRVAPGEYYDARLELRFVSEFWENTTIDGGDQSTESSYTSGDSRLDLYAVPIIE